MTHENRAENHVCPDCETRPVMRENGDAFCDLCNEHIDPARLVS